MLGLLGRPEGLYFAAPISAADHADGVDPAVGPGLSNLAQPIADVLAAIFSK